MDFSLIRRLLCGLALLASGAANAAPAPLTLPPGYKLVWADEFTQDGLPDPAKWLHDKSRNKDGWYNNEQQYYAGPRAENARASQGKLLITATREDLKNEPDWGGQHYSSARLITRGKGDWTYGFFEIRARMPCGKGTWPAIWTLGSAGNWPADGELDILEQLGKDPERIFSTVHRTAGSGGNGAGNGRQLPDACKAFHNYQMLWTHELIRFGVDGVEHFSYANPKTGVAAWPFDAPQFLILNLAIGGDLGGPVDDAIFPVTLEVDHVRVYQAPR